MVFRLNGKQYGKAYNFGKDLGKGDWAKIEETITKILPRTGLWKIKELTGRLKEEFDFIENMPERLIAAKDAGALREKFKNILPK